MSVLSGPTDGPTAAKLCNHWCPYPGCNGGPRDYEAARAEGWAAAVQALRAEAARQAERAAGQPYYWSAVGAAADYLEAQAAALGAQTTGGTGNGS